MGTLTYSRGNPLNNFHQQETVATRAQGHAALVKEIARLQAAREALIQQGVSPMSIPLITPNMSSVDRNAAAERIKGIQVANTGQGQQQKPPQKAAATQQQPTPSATPAAAPVASGQPALQPVAPMEGTNVDAAGFPVQHGSGSNYVYASDGSDYSGEPDPEDISSGKIKLKDRSNIQVPGFDLDEPGAVHEPLSTAESPAMRVVNGTGDTPIPSFDNEPGRQTQAPGDRTPLEEAMATIPNQRGVTINARQTGAGMVTTVPGGTGPRSFGAREVGVMPTFEQTMHAKTGGQWGKWTPQQRAQWLRANPAMPPLNADNAGVVTDPGRTAPDERGTSHLQGVNGPVDEYDPRYDRMSRASTEAKYGGGFRGTASVPPAASVVNPLGANTEPKPAVPSAVDEKDDLGDFLQNEQDDQFKKGMKFSGFNDGVAV